MALMLSEGHAWTSSIEDDKYNRYTSCHSPMECVEDTPSKIYRAPPKKRPVSGELVRGPILPANRAALPGATLSTHPVFGSKTPAGALQVRCYKE
jgi:hypothetical protein